MIDEDNVPVASDPRWMRETLGLHEFLRKPRSWDDLRAWAVSQGLTFVYLRQQLAYLSLHGEARCVGGRDGRWEAVYGVCLLRDSA